MKFSILRKTCERPIFKLEFCSFPRLSEVSWAEGTPEECEKMTKLMVRMDRLNMPKVDGFNLEYLSMKLSRSPDTTPIESDYYSDISSDTSSGSSGDISDFAEEEPGSPNSSIDSSMTIRNTPPVSDMEASSPGSTQDMAIVIDDEEEDSPLCLCGQNLDMIDLTEDTEMDPTPQPEIQPGPSYLEEGRKRKANDLDTYHHPMIESEATGKLLSILSLFILELSQCIIAHQI